MFSNNRKENEEAARRFYEGFLQQMGGYSSTWFSYAEALARIARALWPETMTAPTILPYQAAPKEVCIALMLMGLSLECWAKGLAVKLHPNLVKNGKVDPSLKSHNVRAFRERNFHLSFDPMETQYLDRLAQFVMWAGKYPIPLEEKALVYCPTKPTPLQTTAVGIITYKDLQLFEQIFCKIRDFDHAQTKSK